MPHARDVWPCTPLRSLPQLHPVHPPTHPRAEGTGCHLRLGQVEEVPPLSQAASCYKADHCMGAGHRRVGKRGVALSADAMRAVRVCGAVEAQARAPTRPATRPLSCPHSLHPHARSLAHPPADPPTQYEESRQQAQRNKAQGRGANLCLTQF